MSPPNEKEIKTREELKAEYPEFVIWYISLFYSFL